MPVLVHQQFRSAHVAHVQDPFRQSKTSRDINASSTWGENLYEGSSSRSKECRFLQTYITAAHCDIINRQIRTSRVTYSVHCCLKHKICFLTPSSETEHAWCPRKRRIQNESSISQPLSQIDRQTFRKRSNLIIWINTSSTWISLFETEGRVHHLRQWKKMAIH